MHFAWDPKKAASNLQKHGVSFAEASTVFGDVLSMTFPDPDHSEDETRYITLGESPRRRLLFVSHTDHGDDRIRMISARKATRNERRDYERHYI